VAVLKVFLKHLGFGSRFINFVVAILVNANASIIINGRSTATVDVSLSVRQGCPISPLLFILVLEELSCMIQRALDRSAFKGVYVEEEKVMLAHQFYSDNTTIMIKADAGNVRVCQEMFNRFGNATGLRVNWQETTTVLISTDPVPAELQPFGWKWEETGQFSKLLGLFFGDGIAQEMVKSALKSKLEERISQAKLLPYAYMERKTIINQLFQAGLWYVLALWGGKDEDLKELANMMKGFFWAGRR
jgi:hypothetical protein